MPEAVRYPLYTLLIEVTQKCNAACDQCGSRCDIHGEELLSAEQILSALRDIRDNLGAGTMLNITGGEPLLRRDLFPMMREAVKMGFDWGMVTNGSLITDAVIEEMRGSGMKTITVSVDGLRETHDSLRRLPGCWDRIMAALPKLKHAAFLDHLQVTFTVNRRNLNDFLPLYRMLQKVGIDSVRVSVMDPIGRGAENDSLLLTREELLFFTDLVNRLNRAPGALPVVWGCPHYLGELLEKRKFFCFAGIYTASILVNGDIYVCPNVPRNAALVQGNILKDSFSQVWLNGFRPFRERALPAKCRACRHKEACKGDSLHTLDFETNEPRFCYRDFLERPDPETYKAALFARYPELPFDEIAGPDERADEVIIEPEAWEDLSRYFHMGRRQPQSMCEQQMALIGFRAGNLSVVRYVVPCDGAFRAPDNAIFTERILRTVQRELKLINDRYYESCDALLPGGECRPGSPMRFLGFIHSHPTQSALRYSTGDDAIHRRMYRKFGSYIGILINPAEETVGAYYGRDIRQAKLIAPAAVKVTKDER